ncbi:MAG: hypothetical protein JW715_04095 [Sedimentisphaerales bacterium]|nr:hypothetical protein [Sedimentisphaerales bacterium]
MDTLLEYRTQKTEYRMEQKNDNQLVIEKPQKIYLDTNHLIYISKVRKGEKPDGQSENDYKRLDEYIKSCCGLIFNPAQTMDWIGGGATMQSINEIAAVIDSASLKYTMPTEVFGACTQEVLDQCKEQNPGIQTPDLPLIPQNISDNCTFRSSLAILANQVPGYTKAKLPQGGFPEKIPVSTAAEWVERIFKKEQKTGCFQRRRDSFMKRFNYDIEHKDEYFKNPKPHRLDFIKEELKVNEILEHFNPGVNVDNIIEKIDIEKCHALNLLIQCHEIRLQEGKPFRKENDVNDYIFIPIVPHADFMLIEITFKNTIIEADNSLKTKVFSKVSNFLKVLGI